MRLYDVDRVPAATHTALVIIIGSEISNLVLNLVWECLSELLDYDSGFRALWKGTESLR